MISLQNISSLLEQNVKLKVNGAPYGGLVIQAEKKSFAIYFGIWEEGGECAKRAKMGQEIAS